MAAPTEGVVEGMKVIAAPRPGRAWTLAFLTCTLLGAALVAATGASASAPGPSGLGITPISVAGNPTCQTFDPEAIELKDDSPPFNGTLTSPYGSVSYSSSDGVYFDWSSTLPLDAVFVKGGPGGNLYSYSPEATGDTHLHSPVNPNNGEPFAISHISFCFDLELAVKKTARTSFTRTHAWDIHKSVAPASWDLFAGDSGTSSYDVSVTHTGFTDSDFAVSGTIEITNPHISLPVFVTGVSDVVSVGLPGLVTCPVAFPFLIAPLGTVTCTYSAALPDAADRQNVATATSGTFGVKSGTGSAPVSFLGATVTEVNASVNVDDTNGQSWSFADTATFTYTRRFACGSDGEGSGHFGNTATIRETGQSSSASVDVRCHRLAVEKTAATSYARTFGWTIDKSVSPAAHDLFRGDSASSDYTVSVVKDNGTDSDWKVFGSITVSNPAPIAATVNSVSDLVNGSVAGTVDCGGSGPYVIAAGGSLTCSYTASLPGGDDGTNTATAEQQNHDYSAAGPSPSGTTSYSGSAPVDFGDPSTLVNDTVTVNDTNGASWSFSGSGSQSYSRTFACDADQGSHGNTATIAETGASASASVEVRCHALGVTKDAKTRLTRTYAWTVDKTSDTTGPLTLAPGQSYIVNYTVSVSGSSSDSDWGVSGTISVHNPAPMAATLLSVEDAISGVGAASVDCGVSFPYSLAAGGTLSCSYESSLPDAADRTNEATATLANSPSGSTAFSGSASVSFAGPDVLSIDECVGVSDSHAGVLGTVCAPQLQASFSYSRTLVFSSADCGELTVRNDAWATTNDTGTTTGDSWSIPVTVACQQGCSLTPGYWKTHSENGHAPYDDTWLLIGPSGSNTTFLWGLTYYEALSTPVAGNAWWTLSRAYVAAYMNGLNGADTSAITATLADAYALLAANDPSLGKAKGSTRTDMVELAQVLDAYNNGLIGPGHCSEDSSSN